ncbi:MAG TPA: type VI secretion system-associated FHA domain protein TagH [Rhodanobacteraceae bacterium]|nr:type VI secretion system-associated FHA domain protein TagH [Rhodanobacteraceae bacterium]
MSTPEPQILALSVTGAQAAQLGTRSRKMFVGKDGSIGRAEDCDWVLSSAGVSRVHAMIRYVNGIYFVEDRSTNGMQLNGAPLIKGDPAALKDGDKLRIDNFEISVRLQQDSETIVQVVPRASQPAAEPAAPVAPVAPVAPIPASGGDDLLDFAFGDSPAVAPRAAAGPSSESLIPDTQPANPASLDPLSFLDAAFAPAAPAAEAAPSPSWNHSPGIEDHFRPPTTDVQRQSNALPDDWDLGLGDAPVAPPAPAPVAARPAPPPVAAPPQPPVAPPQPVQAASAAVPGDVDAILRIVVDGVMDVLRARAEIKNNFRLPMTIIQRSENNPLKFALGVDEALQKIMAAPNPAFLSGTAAFDDAFDDIRCHQMAMLAGVRAGFDALLRHFNPDRFEQEFEGGGGVFGGKGKHWQRYREHYQSLVADPDECFRRLFGDEFARAYEDQLARLKSARRMQQARRG